MIRAKFYVYSVTQFKDGFSVVLQPVSSGSDENKNFWKWTPSGKIEMNVINPAVQFEVGEEYYIDFTPSDSADIERGERE